MRTVNLIKYPKFWEEFMMEAYYEHHDRLRLTSSDGVKLLETKFNLCVQIEMGARLGEVKMDDKDYTWFILRWS